MHCRWWVVAAAFLRTEDSMFHLPYEKYPDFKTEDQTVLHPAGFLILMKTIDPSRRPGGFVTA